MNYRAVAIGAGVSLLFGATLLAETAPVGQVRQAGATAVVYQGPQLNVAVSYKFPTLNPEGKWLLLDTTMAATEGPFLIPRSAIAVRTPDGTVVPLASSSQYFRAYPQLAWSITKDNAIREPLGLPIARRYSALRYFPPQGAGLAFDAEWVDYWHNSYGRLFFELPGGVHKGQYELLINLTQSTVVIPFTL
jgi:hypothetical protein